MHRVNPVIGILARQFIIIENSLQRIRFMGAQVFKSRGDYPDDIRVPDTALQEIVDGYFIRRIENRCRGTASPERVIRQPKAWKTLQVRSFKVKFCDLENVQRFRARRNTIRPGESVGDGNSHVRVAHLREYRAIAVSHHRMNDALRMQDDLYGLGSGSE